MPMARSVCIGSLIKRGDPRTSQRSPARPGGAIRRDTRRRSIGALRWQNLDRTHAPGSDDGHPIRICCAHHCISHRHHMDLTHTTPAHSYRYPTERTCTMVVHVKRRSAFSHPPILRLRTARRLPASPLSHHHHPPSQCPSPHRAEGHAHNELQRPSSTTLSPTSRLPSIAASTALALALLLALSSQISQALGQHTTHVMYCSAPPSLSHARAPLRDPNSEDPNSTSSSSPQSARRLRSKLNERFTPPLFFESNDRERRMMLAGLAGVGAHRSGRETSTT